MADEQMSQPFTTASPVRINFSSQEILTGEGNVVFYGGEALDDSATETPVLKTETFASNDIEEISSTGVLTSSFVKVKEINYDFKTSELSQRLRGDCIVEFTFALGGHASVPTAEGYVIAKLIVDDGSETLVGEGRTTTITRSATASYETRRMSLFLSLTETQLKVGDTLRISLEGWAKRDAGGGSFAGNIGWGQDPLDRDGTIITPSSTDDTTILKATVPFALNL